MRALAAGTLVLLSLLAAACGPRKPSADAIEGAVNHAGATAEAVKEKAEGAPAAVPTTGAVPIDVIPGPFRGRWGLTANDCDPRRDDAKGLLQVAEKQLTFYESEAVPSSILRQLENQIRMQLNFAGEGQHWARTSTFTLDGPNVLIREETAPALSLRYTRCPGT